MDESANLCHYPVFLHVRRRKSMDGSTTVRCMGNVWLYLSQYTSAKRVREGENMSEIGKIRDRLWELRNRINAVPNVDPSVRTLVDEMHQLAGAVNAELFQLQQRLETIQVTEEEPQHSKLPNFKEFGGKLKSK